MQVSKVTGAKQTVKSLRKKRHWGAGRDGMPGAALWMFRKTCLRPTRLMPKNEVEPECA